MKNYEEMARDLLARRDAYEQQQKRKKRRRERVVLCAASIALLLLGGFGIWRSGILQQDFDNFPIAEADMQKEIDRSHMQTKNSQTEEKRQGETESKKKRKEKSVKELKPSTKVDSISEDRTQDDMRVQSEGLFVPCNIVWDNRLYEIQDIALEENDLEKKYSKTINNEAFRVYSIKNIAIEKSIAYKRNNIIYQYNCIYNEVFNVNGKEYGLVDWRYYYPEPEKGEYLGKVNGKKIYKVVGNNKAVLIDLTSIVSTEHDNEFLFVAELLE
ncbi:MAG: hypothetical protein HFJ09_07365 [Lachnospiraceae bacterium]|nr:hypothetical protein [Lachnospiraceae bacterium]